MKIVPKNEMTATANAAPVQAESEETADTDRPCIVVGIGASAGGQTALEQMFATMPIDRDLSFLVIMHLPPEGPSFLAGMLSRYTAMEVLTAEEIMLIKPNKVYVIPAGRNLAVKDDRLHLEIPDERNGAHYPIDRLFHTLSEQPGKRIIAVVLSGTGCDGAEGAKKIKAAGGLVIAQEPSSAEYPAMPKSVIDRGFADLILPAAEIAMKIAEISHGYCALPAQACYFATSDENLATVCSLVRNETGHDFSAYKTNTVIRRIERRMSVNAVGGIGKYIALLRENPQEAHALSQDILIGVTSFFRDPEAFATLRRDILPQLLANKNAAEQLRVWHACCSTGEEAYSMAILIKEYLDEHKLDTKVLIFATDIDESAIVQARAGNYDGNIEEDVSEERLKAYFIGGEGRWQVIKPIREMVVFAQQSLIKDPPFSRLDLLVCRNFLIYLNPDMQKRLIALFHQALKPEGVLFLGSSETVGRSSELFATIDKKWKIFKRLSGEGRSDIAFSYPSPTRSTFRTGRPPTSAESLRPNIGEVAEKILMERYSPPCILVDEKYQIAHIINSTKGVLEDPVGEPTRNVLSKAKAALRPALRAAIHKAFAEQKQIVFKGIKVEDSDGEMTVNVLVEPLKTPLTTGTLAMVVFEPTVQPPATPLADGADSARCDEESSRDMLVRQLEEQLRVTSEQLLSTTEQLESSNEQYLSANEELMSINEEFQSANEELQSTNEELETSKEELQTLNEELATVNAELQNKLEELNKTNSDMENLLTSSEIATLFLDRQLNLKGFTPATAAILNLNAADIGRPFRHFAGKIDWSTLAMDAEKVLAGQPFAEREVTTLDSELYYLKRISPYRTTRGKVDGIVITLVDISERKHAEQARMQLSAIVESSDDAILAKDLNGVIRNWNAAAERLFGYPASEAIGKPVTLLIPVAMQAEEDLILQRLSAGERIEHYETVRVAKDGRQIDVSVTVSPIKDNGGRIIGASKIVRDISERKRTEETLRHSQQQNEFLAKILEMSSQPFGVGYPDGRLGLINAAFERLTGYSGDELRALDWIMALTPPEWRDIEQHHLLELQREGQPVRYEKEYIKKDGSRVPIELLVHLATDSEGSPAYFYSFITDISERKRSELALRQQEERLRLALAAARMATWDWHVPSGEVIWNEMHYRMMGYEPGEVIPSYQAWINRVHSDDINAVQANIQRCMAEGSVYNTEFRTLWPDGTIRWLQARGEFEYGLNQQPLRCYGVMIDITERKEAEQALKVADRRKDEFLAMLAHELRNPLAPISNAVEIMKQANTDPSRITWCTEIIDRQIKHLIGLVDDLLDVSRISRGLVELKKEALEIRDFIQPAMEINQPLIDNRRQKFSMALPSEPLWVEGDRIRLAQVISNLINNAAKYSEEGGHISLSADLSEDDVRIRISDNGCGIDHADLSNLFDLFYQAQRDLDRSQGGLGIGLSLVQSLVEKHGGEVRAFSSGRGLGSEFVIRLPRLIVPKPVTAFTTAVSVRNLQKLRILVVEDNQDIAESLAILLEIDGHKIRIANNGSAALEIARSEQLDVILLDIGLPEMDGYSVAQALRSSNGHERTLLIALTGYGQPEDRKKSRAAGFDEHLVKPVNIEILRKLLADYQPSRFHE
ncbi:MAG: PAS domain S-box protein [Methylomonas sp.]|jgi:two-component system CheB/CheR fusion protein